MKGINIVFSLLLHFSIYTQSISKPILQNSDLLEILNEAEYNQNKIDEFEKNSRTKRQYFYRPHLGPVSFDSVEYESDTPPPSVETIEIHEEHNHSKQDEDQPKDADSISITTSFPDTDSNNVEVEKDIQPIEPIHDEQPYYYHPPSTSYGVPIIENSNKEVNIKPNQELISIAEDHIANPSEQKPKSNDITKHKEKVEDNKKNPKILTSYGVPLSSVTGYPPYEIADDNKEVITKNSINLTGGPPSASYGVPVSNKTFSITKNESEKTKSTSNDVKKEEDAKPYNLINSSYGVPLKSVTTLENVSIEGIEIPDSKIKQKFKPDNDDKKIATDSKPIEFISPKKLITMSVDDFEMVNVCIQKSLSAAYTLKDGTLTKDSKK